MKKIAENDKNVYSFTPKISKNSKIYGEFYANGFSQNLI